MLKLKTGGKKGLGTRLERKCTIYQSKCHQYYKYGAKMSWGICNHCDSGFQIN